MSVRLRIKVLRLRQLSMGFSIPLSRAIASGGRQFDKAVERQPVLPHAAVEDQRQARLDPGRAVGNLAEILSALLLGAAEPVGLLTEAERAMVRRDDLEVVGPQAAP